MSIRENNYIICPICERNIPTEYIEKHHIIPRCKKGRVIIKVCISCGDQIHTLFTNKELTKKYNTIDALIKDPKIQKWKEWIRNKPDTFGICIKCKKRKK